MKKILQREWVYIVGAIVFTICIVGHLSLLGDGVVALAIVMYGALNEHERRVKEAKLPATETI